MTRKSTYYLAILMISIVLALGVKLVRPYIVGINSIVDILLSASPNFFATSGFCMLVLLFATRKEVQIMSGLVTGLLIYELEQYWTARTFDFYDILATLTAYMGSLIFFRVFTKKT